MTLCPSCGADGPEGARFCPSCGSALTVRHGTATERKVVTTLFADIVGFTALSERFDPEDVDAALRGYFAMARTTIERFGGAVEKYIGDAVVGVYGVPTAHEDDAERAVRAALAIVEGVGSLPPVGGEELHVRVGVNTGRALVRLNVHPGSGEGILVGDAVNTAARLLAAAPPMCVVVGDRTCALSDRAIDYEQLPSFFAKGKAQPLKACLARGTIARRGTEFERTPATEMIGREVELGMLSGLFEKACASSTPQYALITGEAGIGKSRLVHELGQVLDRRPGIMCTWRQGRCPPYGEGLAFWPLSEMVKAHAGILRNDGPVETEAKLARSLSDARDEWLLARMRPLVGLSAPHTDREENFAAWVRFFQALARTRPTILVVEDLHWASEPTLAFLEHLIEHLTGVPLILLGTARPELLDRHDLHLERFVDALVRINLKSLTLSESERLASSLPGAGDVPDIQARVAERSGGNPLFTEEIVRYLVERQARDGDDSTAPLPEQTASAPDSIFNIIAARLDAMPADHKSVLADAAVVGQVFWPGALCALGDRESGTVDRVLGRLEEREFVRRSGSSTLAGASEFAFWHGLTREVAYEQLPRADRASKHAAVGRWIESVANLDKSGLAEVLGYHYSTAYHLANATGQHELTDELREPALRALKLAGDCALPLDVGAAEQYYGRAAELARETDPLRPDILLGWARALFEGGHATEAQDKAAAAVNALRSKRVPKRLAQALSTQAHISDWLGDPRSDLLYDEALGLAEDAGPSPEQLNVLEAWVASRATRMDYEPAMSGVAKAMRLSRQLHLSPSPTIVHWRGVMRCDLGDERGLVDLQRSLEQARQQGLGWEASRFAYNYAQHLLWYRGPRASRDVVNDEITHACERGDATANGYLTLARLLCLWLLGEWQSFRSRARELDRVLAAQHDTVDLILLRSLLGMDLAVQEDPHVTEQLAWIGESLKSDLDASTRQVCLAASVALHAASCDPQAASRSADALVRTAVLCGTCEPQIALYLPEAARHAARAGVLSACAAVSSRLTPDRPTNVAARAGVDALVMELAGDHAAAERTYREAAGLWADLEVPYELAHACLGRARCLVSLGRAAEAEAALSDAREGFTWLDARPALKQCEAFRALHGLLARESLVRRGHGQR